MVAIMKRNKKLKKPGWEYLKTWVGKFQVGNFWVGIHKGGVWLVRIFWMGVFLISLLLSKKCSKIYCLRPVTNYQWRHQYFRFFSSPHYFITLPHTSKKMKFSIKHFFCKCDQIRSFLRIWSHLQKRFWTQNFIFCALTAKTRGL